MATIVQAKTFVPNGTSVAMTLDSSVSAGNAIIVITLGSGTRTYGFTVPTDGALTEDESIASAALKSTIHSIFDVTGGFTDVTSTSNFTGDRWVTVVEVSGLGASPTISTGSEDTDTTDVNVTTHNCAAVGIDGATGDFVIGGGRLNAAPGTLTRNAALSADYTQASGGYGFAHWGILGSGTTADKFAYTSSGARQHVNTLAGYSGAAPDTTAPTISSATIGTDGETFTIVFDEAVTGDEAGFILTPSGGSAGITYVSGSGTDTLVFSIDRVIFDSETGTLEYVAASGTVADLASNVLANYGPSAVTNNSTQIADVTAPTLSTATVTAATTLTLIFDEAVTLTDQTGMTVASSGAAVTVTGVSGDGTDTLALTLSRSIASTESLSFSYDSGTGDVEDLSANALASISARLITNNITSSGGSTLIGSGLIQ